LNGKYMLFQIIFRSGENLSYEKCSIKLLN
jgi:hypothetical protein